MLVFACVQIAVAYRKVVLVGDVPVKACEDRGGLANDILLAISATIVAREALVVVGDCNCILLCYFAVRIANVVCRWRAVKRVLCADKVEELVIDNRTAQRCAIGKCCLLGEWSVFTPLP